MNNEINPYVYKLIKSISDELQSNGGTVNYDYLQAMLNEYCPYKVEVYEGEDDYSIGVTITIDVNWFIFKLEDYSKKKME